MTGNPEKEFEPFVWKIPVENQEDNPLEIIINQGDRVFVVGANGSGKSALIQHLVVALGHRRMRRLSAHRQTWFSSSTIDITPKARFDYFRNLSSYDQRDDARWMDHIAPQRLSVVLFDLIAKENERAREITSLVDGDSMDDA